MKWATISTQSAYGCEVQVAPSPSTPFAFFAFLSSLRENIGQQPDRVVIGFPGPVMKGGTLSFACTLWPGRDLAPLRFVEIVQSIWVYSSVMVINDVSAYGEFLLFRGATDFCVVNIGSGIGFKLYVSGHEVLGTNQRGGELGHWRDPLIPKQLTCDCGEVGHIGAMSSGRGVARYAALIASQDVIRYGRSALSQHVPNPAHITSEALVEAVNEGDPFSCDILRDAMAPLGRGVSLIHLATGCERFVLVGGFASALGKELPRILADHSRATCWGNGYDWSDAYESLPDEVCASLLGLHYYGIRNASI